MDRRFKNVTQVSKPRVYTPYLLCVCKLIRERCLVYIVYVQPYMYLIVIRILYVFLSTVLFCKNKEPV